MSKAVRSYGSDMYKGISYEVFHDMIHEIEKTRHIDAGDDMMGTLEVIKLMQDSISLHDACWMVGVNCDGTYMMASERKKDGCKKS